MLARAARATASGETSRRFPTPLEACERLWSLCYPPMLALGIVGYPLVATVMAAIGNHVRGVSIAFRGLELGLALVILCVNGHAQSSLPKQALAVCAGLWAALLLRYTWDATMVSLPLDLPWADYGLLIVGTVLVPAMAAVRVCDLNALDRAARLVLIFGLVVGVLIAIGFALAARDFLIAGRLGFETLNPISIGHLGTTLVILSVLAPERGSKPRGLLERTADVRLIRWLSGAIGLTLLIASASRGPALALIVAFVVLRLNRDVVRHGMLGVIRAATIVTAACSVLAGLLLSIVDDPRSIPLVARMISIASDRAVSVREELIAGALRQFESSPIVGSSFMELAQRFYPHNILVEALMTTGVIGFALLIVLLIMATTACYRLLRTPFAWLALLWVQSFVGSMSSGSMYFDGPLWLVMLAMLGADWALRSGGEAARAELRPASAQLVAPTS